MPARGRVNTMRSLRGLTAPAVACILLACIVHCLGAAGDTYDSIYDALADNGAKTYLEGAKKANRFDKQLSDPGTIATVFAPSDKAFERFFERANITPKDFYANTSLLVDVMQYHVVPGVARPVKGLTNGLTMTSMRGKELTIAKSGLGDVIVMSGSNARIRDADLKTPSAYVHIVDNLLLPKDSLAAYAIAQAATVSFFKTLDEAILDKADLSGFANLLDKADMLELTQDPATTGTLFAPTNSALDTVKSQLNTAGANTTKLFSDKKVLKELILAHYLKGKVMRRNDLIKANGTNTTMANGQEVSISANRVALPPPVPPPQPAALPMAANAVPGAMPAAAAAAGAAPAGGVSVVDPYVMAQPAAAAALALPAVAGATATDPYAAAAAARYPMGAAAGFPAAGATVAAGYPASTAPGTYPATAAAVPAAGSQIMASPSAAGVGPSLYGRLRKLLQFAAAAAAPVDTSPGAVFAAPGAAPAAAPAAPVPPPVMVTHVYLADDMDEPYMVSPEETVGGRAVLHSLEGVILPPSLAEYFTNTTTPLPGRKKAPKNATAVATADVTATPGAATAATAAAANATATNSTVAARRPTNGAHSRFPSAVVTLLSALPALVLAGLMV